ncbi:DEAD/DEAH box helicase [Companilactobacillus heilongjiangensis]|uniref:Helicase ATP-binding domain-containing protein n=1 Tax=Companilactobacillus heilongjiangensis TaxID=1074467 RepID=A0A0K2LAC0_9LACO|nr:DEAD/DEAH box helicase [Companilactobacillus heilongjiangensis]ALB28257.1 hypothetical protein JP39_02045 [Companilactobacillus heilongjiangensis]
MSLLDNLQINPDNNRVETVSWKIFDTLIHDFGYEYLRSVQKDFLQRWESRRDEKDLLGVLSTGTGKTLIGLLTLQARLNKGEGPCIYLCPNNQLVDQVIAEAKHHGIKVVTLIAGRNGREAFPFEFTSGKAILVITFSTMVNGYSRFGVDGADYVQVGSIVIDDAHTAISLSRQAATVSIIRDDNKGSLYNRLLNLFEDDLKKQNNAKYTLIKSGAYSKAVMCVPYWLVIDYKEQIEKILNDTDDQNKFNLPFVLNNINNLQITVASDEIDISPMHTPIEMIPSFSNADHRLFLSATFTNGADFITELNVSEETLKKQLVVDGADDNGEKLIIAPQRIHPQFTDQRMREKIIKWVGDEVINTNVVVLVPSRYAANPWERLGAKVFDGADIYELIDMLKVSNNKVAVVVNRYDGIDLAGDLCHCLVLDGLPTQSTNREKAISQREPGSEEVLGQTAREIEQGIGRSVRSGADSSLIFLLGTSLQEFVALPNNKHLFTDRTQAQLQFSEKILNVIGESNSNEDEVENKMLEIMQYSLNRNMQWQKTYHDNVNQNYEVLFKETKHISYAHAESIRKAWIYAIQGNYVEAVSSLRQITEKDEGSLKDEDIMLEQIATYQYHFDKNKALDTQLRAKNLNKFLFTPSFYQYSKRTRKTMEAGLGFKRLIDSFNAENGNDLAISFKSQFDKLIYDESADESDFRKGIEFLGTMLGFDSSQPEQEIDVGPDNLWIGENIDFILESKNKATSDFISKVYAEQLASSFSWYKHTYPRRSGIMISLHPVNLMDKQAFVDGVIYVLTKEKLKTLSAALRNVLTRLSSKNPTEWTVKELQNMLSDNSLTEKQFILKYTEKVKRRS